LLYPPYFFRRRLLMTKATRLLGILALGIATGCQQAPHGPAAGQDFFVPPASLDSVGVRRFNLTTGDGPNGAHIIFLNFDGAMLSAPPNGYGDDASQNQSWIAGGAINYPAFDAKPYAPAFTRDAAINAITNIFKQIYAPINVVVTTTRPPSGKSYTMCMVGGSPQLIGQQTGVAGIAPLDCGNQNESDVTYAFSADLDPSTTGSASESLRAIASTAAQETAHSYGLGHTTNKTDIMYPELLPGQNSFGGPTSVQQDGSGKCGDGKTQDSLGMLKNVLGASSGMMQTGPTPMVGFVTPTKGSTVPLDFTIIVTASEPGGTISKVEVTSGGQSVLSATAPPYKADVTAPGEGDYELTATAYDTNGNFQTASVTFTAKKGAPPQVIGCMTKNDCNQGMICQDGQCAMPGVMPGMSCSAMTPCPSGFACQPDGSCSPTMSAPMPGETGATCGNEGDCHSGICGTFNGQKLCTAPCDPHAPASCPSTMTCAAAGSDFVCAPNANNGGRGCSAVPTAPGPGGRGGAAGWLLALACALLGLRRRFA
jgi:hypothetical protein